MVEGHPDLNERLRLCPACFAAIERSQGCDHMMCVCGKAFNCEPLTMDPEDRQSAAPHTMKMGRSSFWWKCHW